MKKRTKYLLAGLGIVVVVGVAAGTITRRQNRAVEVKIDTVEPRDLVASVTASGQVGPHTKVDVSADITGRITRLSVKEGDIVRKGQFLLEIDPSAYRAAVERAEANKSSAEQAKATLAGVRSTYERTAELKRRNPSLVADEQLEQLRTQVEVNKAAAASAVHNVAQAQGALRDAQSALNKTTIVAPISGRITRLNIEEGETAITGALNKDAATLLTISDMSDLEIKVKVDETDVSRIKLGDSAIVQLDAFSDTTFRGRVTQISNSSTKMAGGSTTGTTDQAVDYEVTVKLLDAPPQTRPDFSATAKIVTDSRRKVLTIPIIALTIRENTPVSTGDSAVTLGRQPAKQVGKKDVDGVFVVGADKKVIFRPVRIGITGENYHEVLSGLRRGERIVGGTYQAIRELKDGTTVR
jgi:HlyD family secretion protein